MKRCQNIEVKTHLQKNLLIKALICYISYTLHLLLKLKTVIYNKEQV